MIGRDAVAAEALTADFRAVAGFDSLPPNWRKLFDEVLASAVDDRVPGAILPAPVGGGCKIYAVAADQKEWRRLRPLLYAYMGPTLTNFTGVIQAPSGSDPLDTFARALPVEVIAIAEANGTSVEALRAVRRMIAALHRAPNGASQLPRPTSWLLSDFEDALNVGDRTTAERLIARLRDECRLDALNLRFLTVQLLASLGEWLELRNLPFFVDLCLARKPGAIAAHLAEALFRVDLAAAFSAADVVDCRRAYEDIRPLAAPLIVLPPPAALRSDGWRLYALAALTADDPDPALLGALAGRSDLGWIAGELDKPQVVAETFVPPEPEADFAQIRKALERLAELPQAERERLLEIVPIQSLLASDSEVTPDLVPLNWHDWLARISDPDYTQAFEIARKGKDEWPLDSTADPVEAAALAEALADALADDVSRARLAQALPLIVGWLQRDGDFPRPSMRPIYETVLTLFVLGEARDRGIMSSAGVIGEALLAIGNSATDYQRLLESLTTLIAEGMGTGNIYLLLDLIEATLRYPCPDTSAREAFWLSALAVIEPLRIRLKPVQLASIAALGELLGWQEPPLPENSTTDPDDLGGKLANLRIAIYTLTESAARQAVSVLNRVAPSATIQTSSEHVGSAQLKALSENADIFVITSLSAKHAATDYIRAHRPPGKPICWAAGRGFTSIVRAIEDFLSEGMATSNEAQANS